MALKQPQHILLVEGDEDTLSATTAMLESLGYSVRTETESLKALRTFSEEPDHFDLALLDHGMADLSGLELAQRMRRIRPGFPVVLYTGYLDDPSTEQLESRHRWEGCHQASDPEGAFSRDTGHPGEGPKSRGKL